MEFNGILKIFKLSLTDVVRQAFEQAVIIYNYVSKPVISYRQAAEFEKLMQEHAVISTAKKSYRSYFSPCLKILSYGQRKIFDPKEQEGFLERDYAVLTFLGPDKDGVEEVYRDYRKHPAKASPELANRTSIVFLLEYGERAAHVSAEGCFHKRPGGISGKMLQPAENFGGKFEPCLPQPGNRPS